MDGEIITRAEMQKAADHATTLQSVMVRIDAEWLTEELVDVVNFLNDLSWKGAAR